METTDKRIEEKVNELHRKWSVDNYNVRKLLRQAIEYGESLSRDRAVKEEEFRSTLIELIKWNDKYPPGKIYDYGRANTMEKQLTAIVDRAKEFISPIETKEQ